MDEKMEELMNILVCAKNPANPNFQQCVDVVNKNQERIDFINDLDQLYNYTSDINIKILCIFCIKINISMHWKEYDYNLKCQVFKLFMNFLKDKNIANYCFDITIDMVRKENAFIDDIAFYVLENIGNIYQDKEMIDDYLNNIFKFLTPLYHLLLKYPEVAEKLDFLINCSLDSKDKSLIKASIELLKTIDFNFINTDEIFKKVYKIIMNSKDNSNLFLWDGLPRFIDYGCFSPEQNSNIYDLMLFLIRDPEIEPDTKTLFFSVLLKFYEMDRNIFETVIEHYFIIIEQYIKTNGEIPEEYLDGFESMLLISLDNDKVYDLLQNYFKEILEQSNYDRIKIIDILILYNEIIPILSCQLVNNMDFFIKLLNFGLNSHDILVNEAACFAIKDIPSSFQAIAPYSLYLVEKIIQFISYDNKTLRFTINLYEALFKVIGFLNSKIPGLYHEIVSKIPASNDFSERYFIGLINVVVNIDNEISFEDQKQIQLFCLNMINNCNDDYTVVTCCKLLMSLIYNYYFEFRSIQDHGILIKPIKLSFESQSPELISYGFDILIQYLHFYKEESNKDILNLFFITTKEFLASEKDLIISCSLDYLSLYSKIFKDQETVNLISELLFEQIEKRYKKPSLPLLIEMLAYAKRIINLFNDELLLNYFRVTLEILKLNLGYDFDSILYKFLTKFMFCKDSTNTQKIKNSIIAITLKQFENQSLLRDFFPYISEFISSIWKLNYNDINPKLISIYFNILKNTDLQDTDIVLYSIGTIADYFGKCENIDNDYFNEIKKIIQYAIPKVVDEDIQQNLCYLLVQLMLKNSDFIELSYSFIQNFIEWIKNSSENEGLLNSLSTVIIQIGQFHEIDENIIIFLIDKIPYYTKDLLELCNALIKYIHNSFHIISENIIHEYLLAVSKLILKNHFELKKLLNNDDIIYFSIISSIINILNSYSNKQILKFQEEFHEFERLYSIIQSFKQIS